MNFTYYYYCECGYNHVAHVKEGQTLYRCSSCFNIEGKESQEEFLLECRVCGQKETITGDIDFSQKRTCSKCHTQGKVGLFQDKQFQLHTVMTIDETCSTCRKKRLCELIEEEPCPFCFKTLKTRMSNYWEAGEKE